MACNIDHSLEDVKKKFAEQKPFLPKNLIEGLEAFFQLEQTQEVLNEVFHQLKKYDLADEAERKVRNERLRTILGA